MRLRYHLLYIGGFVVLGTMLRVPAIGEAEAQTAAEARGQVVYDKWCAPCHAPGPGHPGTQSLEVKYRGEIPAVLTERDDLTPEFVRLMVRQGILMMAPFRKTEVTDAELDDIAAYLAGE